jgi:transcription-repair coupling factor (superfamily II helicase)
VSLAGLVDVALTDPILSEAVNAPPSGRGGTLAVPIGIDPLLIAAIANRSAATVLVVTATSRDAEDVAAAVRAVVPPGFRGGIVELPSWETLPHERLSPRTDTVGRRMAVFRRLAHPITGDRQAGPLSVIVAPVRSLLQPIPAGLGDLDPVRLAVGDEADLDEIVRRLTAVAYTRVDLVSRRGELAVRGGILDVFPPTEEHPLRVEFFGDAVEDIRSFSVSDQRSIATAKDGLWAVPCRELLLTDEVRARAKSLASEHRGLADIFDSIAAGVAVEGMEALSPVLTDRMELLVDVVSADTQLVVCSPERVRRRAHDLIRTGAEFLAAAWGAAAAGDGTAGGPLDLGTAAFHPLDEVHARATERGLAWWEMSPLGAQDLPSDTTAMLSVDAHDLPPYGGDLPRVVTDIRSWLAVGHRVVWVTEGHGSAERIVELLRADDIPVRLVEDLKDVPDASVVQVATGRLSRGFVAPTAGLVVLTEADVTGSRGKSSTKDMRQMPSRRRAGIDPLQLTPGDYVVHEQHGVGRYVEMAQRSVGDALREYLVVEYAPARRGQPGDRLYVPTDALDQVTRYVGGEAPALHRLGGAEWSKTKGRARKAVRQIAGELIRLYSARQASEGHAFGPDTPWQAELEDAFPFVETPDQLACVDEVKRDMERAVPMDRLICGDVGYGKTEIAIRAAFKAVQDGKQVAVLVPTTLLVQQHFSTFTERYANFPVRVRAMSRFNSPREQAEVLAGLADGTIDVVVGTHRLLGRDTVIRDLGLVIVDEEQRFGVEHKEQLKRLRTAVDVLTMSATPIPRTLEMAVTGIREMSTITTPPEERHPVLTFVGPQEDAQVAAALRRELLRDGQVFYIHNRVASIDRTAARLRELVPEARIQVGHGQMSEVALEKVMVGFWEKDFDVLVCTTIVESGLDIPNANTLVVERSDTFGLSQMHQLRGRVGRGRERAYAYFLFPPERPLTETAHDRLATLAQHADLGAGMAVAMKDLEIRGAGNMLGGEQSGHIAGVGFDLYLRMVGEAVAEFRGADMDSPGAGSRAEMRIELPVDAHLPHDYIPGERLRLEAYTRLAAVADEEQLGAVRAELADRYGPPPTPVDTLFAVASFRLAAQARGLTEVVQQGKQLRFGPVELPESAALRLARLYPGTLIKPAGSTILVPRPATARVGGEPLRDVALLTWCRDLLTVLGPIIVSPKGSS